MKRFYICASSLFEFRKDPVPGTGKHHRYSRCKLVRYQRFAQEFRLSFADIEYVRPGRFQQLHYLSLYSGDDWRSDCNNKYSWKKRKKKKQWM